MKMMGLLSIVSILILMSGCAMVMSGDDINEHIELMKQHNAIGCAYIAGSGTPPASRVDGAVLGGWGQDMTTAQMLECMDKLKQIQ